MKTRFLVGMVLSSVFTSPLFADEPELYAMAILTPPPTPAAPHFAAVLECGEVEPGYSTLRLYGSGEDFSEARLIGRVKASVLRSGNRLEIRAVSADPKISVEITVDQSRSITLSPLVYPTRLVFDVPEYHFESPQSVTRMLHPDFPDNDRAVGVLWHRLIPGFLRNCLAK